MPISFTVDNGQVTFVNLGYSVQSDGCSLSGSLSKSVTEQIAANAFSILLSDDDGKAYAFAGTLTADGKASGTINVKGTSQSCGAFDSKATWQAKLGQDDSSSSQGN
jgi:hypothetical protein